jgi:hypothetical protein
MAHRPNGDRTPNDSSDYHVVDQLLSPDSGGDYQGPKRSFSPRSGSLQQSGSDHLEGVTSKSSDLSTDSIIRRVEEEIAAARKAAASAKNRLGPAPVPEPDDEDMQDILNTTSTVDGHNSTFQQVHSNDRDEISLDRTEDFFGDEFQSCASKEDVTSVGELSVIQEARQALYVKEVTPEENGTEVEPRPSDEQLSPLQAIVEVENEISSSSTSTSLIINDTTPAYELQSPIKASPSADTINENLSTGSAELELAALTRTQQRKGENNTPVIISRSNAPSLSITSSDREIADIVHGSGSGELAGDRARAILDTLKERRENFSTHFRSSSCLSNPPSPVPPSEDVFKHSIIGGPASETSAPSLGTNNYLKGALSMDAVSKRLMCERRMTEITTSALETAEIVNLALPMHASTKLLNSGGPKMEAASLDTGEVFNVASTMHLEAENRQIVDEKKEDESDDIPARNEPASDLASPAHVKRRLQKTKSENNTHTETSDKKAALKVSENDDAINRKSRRIRFRDTFPVLKPTNRPRAADEIIADYLISKPVFPICWVRPKNNLKQLIVAAMGNSLPRRSNACGAFKVLTRQKKNQLTLARTDGFMEALVFAASQEIPSKPDDRELALVCRTRAVACLSNVCEPKDNRVHILTHPGNKECLMKVILDDDSEARVLACVAFALLAKTPECREIMTETEGLLDILAQVMLGQEAERQIAIESSASSLERTRSEPNYSSNDESHRSRYSSQKSDDRSASTGYSSNSHHEQSSRDSADDISDEEISKKTTKKTNNSIRCKNEEKRDEFYARARANACAALMHLSKHCAVMVSRIVPAFRPCNCYVLF